MRHSRVLGLASAGAMAAALAITGPASAAAGTVALRNSRSPVAAKAPRDGSVAGSTLMSFAVNLRLADQQGAQAFALAVSTPGSSAYGHYLTPAQWESRFSPTAADVGQVKAFLTRNGFTVSGVSPDRMSVYVSGTAAQVEHTFGTALSYHDVRGAKLLLADKDLSVPAGLGGVIGGVTGVSDTRAHPDSTVGGPATAATTSAGSVQPDGFRAAPPCGTYFGQKIDTALPLFGGFPANPPWAVCGYTGPQLRSAYNLSGAADGTGVTVAIVDAYVSPTLFSDAHHFAALNDPSHPLADGQFSEVQAASFNHADDCGATGWYGEQTLDVEAVHDTAPGAKILFAGAENCSTTALNQMLSKIVDGHLANVITNSYGDLGGDVLDSASDREATDNILAMAAATGVSVLFSSGDSGDEFTTLGAPVPDYPASSPFATAVGGTSLEIGSGGQRTLETGWSTARSFLCNETMLAQGGCTDRQLHTWLPINEALDGGSGGGTSYVYRQPAYQKGVVPAVLSQRNSAFVGPDPMRVEPDISMEADPATGMLVGETQTFPNGTYYDQYRIGGTSVASPLLAGVVARADQAAGHPLGFLNPSLYSLHGNAGALYDVQATHQDQSRADFANSIDSSQGFLFSTRIIDYQGQEQFCNPITSECTTRDVAISAAPGYDSMTGLGAPNAGFVQALSRP